MKIEIRTVINGRELEAAVKPNRRKSFTETERKGEK
jgi:hypothetical protein